MPVQTMKDPPFTSDSAVKWYSPALAPQLKKKRKTIKAHSQDAYDGSNDTKP